MEMWAEIYVGVYSRDDTKIFIEGLDGLWKVFCTSFLYEESLKVGRLSDWKLEIGEIGKALRASRKLVFRLFPGFGEGDSM